MYNNNKEITVLLLLPDIEINTTSVNRYKSIIKELCFQKYNVKVISFNYPWDKSNIVGNEITQVDILEDFVTQNLFLIDAKLNFLQKLAFKLLKISKSSVWKVLNYTHHIIYQKDIFNPGNLSLQDLKIGELTQKGFIITSGGPFGLFSFAKKLSFENNYKLILDYRDPWTFGYTSLNSRTLIHKLKITFSRKKERKILEASSLIITVSDSLKSFFPKKLHSKIKVYHNGSNFNSKEISLITPRESFNIVYAGTVYDIQLKDESFFEAFSLFISDKDKSRIKLSFLGANNNNLLRIVVNKYSLDDVCEITKRLQKPDLLKALNNASIFLHLKYGNNGNIITSKQADYLAFKRPILLPTSDFGDLEKSITETNSGTVCQNIKQSLNFLEMQWKKFVAGENLILDNKVNIESREDIAVKIIQNLNHLRN